jgi:hypothetical protein
MVPTDLDKPPDMTVQCLICKEPLKVTHYWIATFGHWMRPSIHNRCVDRYARHMAGVNAKDVSREIPERYTGFNGNLCPPGALQEVAEWGPDHKWRVCAIVGSPHKGKSRLAWATVTQYFDLLYESTGAKRWVDYFQFETLMSEFDRATINKIANAHFAFIDDVGAIDSYGRERALLQAAIRTRIKGNKTTLLTIDDMGFDPELEHVLKGRALVVPV